MDSRIFFLPTMVIALLGVGTWWYLRPENFGLILLLILLINLIAAWWLNGSRRDWLVFSILPLVLLASGLSYGLVVSDQRLALIVVIIATLSSFLYWRLVFLYVFQHLSYRPFSLERFSSYLTFLAVFFSVAAAYGVKTFLDIPAWQLGSLMTLILVGLSYQWLWIQKTDFKIAWRYAAAFVIIIIEFFFIFGFLPVDFNIIGFILASLWYSLSSLASDHLGGRLNMARLRLTLGLTVIAWLAVLLTARWF